MTGSIIDDLNCGSDFMQVFSFLTLYFFLSYRRICKFTIISHQKWEQMFADFVRCFACFGCLRWVQFRKCWRAFPLNSTFSSLLSQMLMFQIFQTLGCLITHSLVVCGSKKICLDILLGHLVVVLKYDQ